MFNIHVAVRHVPSHFSLSAPTTANVDAQKEISVVLVAVDGDGVGGPFLGVFGWWWHEDNAWVCSSWQHSAFFSVIKVPAPKVRVDRKPTL